MASSDFGHMLSVGAIRFEEVGLGEVGGSTALPDSAWGWLQLPVEKPWSMMGGPFVWFLAQTGVENAPSPCRDSISGNLGSF